MMRKTNISLAFAIYFGLLQINGLCSDSIAEAANLASAPLEPAPALTLRDYAEFKTTTLVDWHPITKQALVRTSDARGQQLQMVETIGGKMTPLTDLAIHIGHAVFEPKVGSYLLYEKAVGNAVQIMRLEMGHKNAVVISGEEPHIAGNIAFNRAGDAFTYAVTSAAQNSSTALYLHTGGESAGKRLLATLDGAGYADFKFAPDGKSLVYVQNRLNAESIVWQLDVATGRAKRLTPALNDANNALKMPYLWASPRHSQDGKSLFLLSNKDSDFKRLCKLDIATGELIFLSNFSFDIDEFLISVRQNRIALRTNEQGSGALRFLDLTTFKELPRPPLMLSAIGGLRWRGALDEDDSEGVDGIEVNKKPFSARTELGFTLTSARSPSDVFTAQLGGRINRWTNSANPNINPLALVEPTVISFKSADNLTISGFYYPPDALKFPGKRPVMVELPNGTTPQFTPEYLGRKNYAINEQGIALIRLNTRGATGFGRAFFAAGQGDKRAEATKDVGALLAWVAGQPNLDAAKVIPFLYQ